jgi:ATP-binding cassette subfamily C protein
LKRDKFEQPKEAKLKMIDALSVLNRKEKRRYFFYVFLQVILSILDLIGLGLVSILGVLSVNNLQGTPPNSQIDWILNQFNLGTSSLLTQLVAIGGIATGILILRTILSVVFMKKLLLFLSRKFLSRSF